MAQYSFTPRPIQKDRYYRGAGAGIRHGRRLEPWAVALIAVGAALVLGAAVFCILYFTGAGTALASPAQDVLPLPTAQPAPTPEAVDAALVIGATDTDTTVLPETPTPTDAAATSADGYVYTPGDLVVALTFDDGPLDSRTKNVLDVLEQYGVVAPSSCRARTSPATRSL